MDEINNSVISISIIFNFIHFLVLLSSWSKIYKHPETQDFCKNKIRNFFFTDFYVLVCLNLVSILQFI